MTKNVFVSGIPASGKSFLANKIAKEFGIRCVKLDLLRKEMWQDSALREWVDFFKNKDETKYWKSFSCEEHWGNLKKQSEALWRSIIKKVEEIKQSNEGAIFETVNILPHLAKRDLDFPGIYLLGESVETIFARNQQSPRWGTTEELQRKEAEVFYVCEGPMYKKEAEKYGYKIFTDSKEAEKELRNLLSF